MTATDLPQLQRGWLRATGPAARAAIELLAHSSLSNLPRPFWTDPTWTIHGDDVVDVNLQAYSQWKEVASTGERPLIELLTVLLVGQGHVDLGTALARWDSNNRAVVARAMAQALGATR